MIYAHSVPGKPETEWERLADHCEAVASRAALFAESFEGQQAARILGLTHDLGKAKSRFQAKLRGQVNDEPHSAEGALFLRAQYGAMGTLLAACVAGHHSGLPDASDLRHRLDKTADLALPDWLDLPPSIPPFGPLTAQADAFSIQFAIRMLFSCLVDADEQETATFYDASTPSTPDTVTETHRQAFNIHMREFKGKEGPVNALRAQILETVRERSSQSPGLFSLTVPTGGGKTLASLGFALDHARAHGMVRVIHVIPFTSIVEQTADVFSDVLGSDAVVEHHSSFDWDRVTDDEEQKRLYRVTRNWDAPIVVTTAVQFFESLFAARKRRCVKLHNLARTVIVIDEAQTMPQHLLRPCLAAIRELATHYGASIVLSTATQPAVTRAAGLNVPEALEDVRELAPDPPALYRALRRTRVVDAGPMDDDALAGRIETSEQVLAIVGTRRHARALFNRLADLPGAAHLSTVMTGMHRRHVLAEVRTRLKKREPVRLVSTSLVEAGVDVDFPLVMRAIAGLDSIAQAAGRCNREGKGANLGEVLVFTPTADEAKSSDAVMNMADIAQKVMAAHPDDPLTATAIAAYFERMLWQSGPEALDAAPVGEDGGAQSPGIMAEINGTGNDFAFRFASIARAFRMIDDGQAPVIIRGGRWGIGDKLLNELEWSKGAGGIARKLQPFIVNLPHRTRRELTANRAASVWREDLFGREFLLLNHDGLYDDRAGLRMERFDEASQIV